MEPVQPSPIPGFLLSNDPLRTLHAMLLNECGEESTRHFWSKNCLKVYDEPFSLRNTLEHIWNPKAGTPLAEIVRVFGSLEEFLHGQGHDSGRFIEKLYSKVHVGSLTSAQRVLFVMEPFMTRFFVTRSLRCFIIKNSPVFITRLFPGISMDLAAYRKHAGCCTAILTVRFEVEFGPNLLPLNCHAFIATPLRYAPVRLGLSPYEEVVALCDLRQPRQILNGLHTSVTAHGIFMDNQCILQKRSFTDFCVAHGLKLAPQPECEVWEACRDLKLNGRHYLHKGCVYAAPLYAVKVKYTDKKNNPAKIMTSLVRELLHTEKTTFWNRAAQAHQRLIDQCEKSLVLAWDARRRAVLANGTEVARGLAAQLLWYMIQAHEQSQKTLFSYKEFWQMPSIGPCDNIGLRLRRLINRLPAKVPDLQLEKAGRGQVRFKMSTTARVLS